MTFKIPLDTNIYDQAFYITLPLDSGNIPVHLRLRYNTEGAFWRMDITDMRTNTELASGVPILAGQDLLGQLAHFGLGAAAIIKASTSQALDSPDYTCLGTDFVLIWGDEYE